MRRKISLVFVFIVQVAQIVSAKRDLRGRYTLTLRDRSETLRASQPYGHLFKHM